MHPTRFKSRISLILASLTTSLFAVPTAVDDSFTTPEDVAAGNSAVTVINANFDASASAFTLPANWQYNDGLLTSAAGGNNQYPVDEEGNNWRALAFDPSTSNRGTWKTAPMPIQAGGIDGLAGAVNLLEGITGNNGVNTVNGYLFRNKFTITTADAAVASTWAVSVLADDSCIVYLNGNEIGRSNWSVAVPIEPDALGGGNAGSETAYNLITFPSSAFLNGENVFAVQLNQNTNNSSDAGIDFRLAPSATSGFVGLDDAFFGTARADFESQSYAATGGFSGTGALRLEMGSVFAFGGNTSVSAAWRHTFSLASPETITLTFRYRMLSGQDYDAGEYQEVLCDIDGTQYGTTTAPSTHPSVAFLVGDGNGGGAKDTGWQQRTFTIPLSAGNHTLSLGGYANAGTAGFNRAQESFQINFDDVNLVVPGSVSLLSNDTRGVAPVTAVKASNPSHGTVTVNPDGSFNYLPASNYFGTDSFTYRAVDSTGESAPATVTITVAAVNDIPLAVNDGPYLTPQGEVLAVGVEESVLKNDTDVETTVLTAVLGTSTGGTTVLNPNGSFTFTPNPGFAGSASFTYRATDGTAQSTPATVTINITDFPDPPTANNDAYTAVKNTPLVVTATTISTAIDEVLPYGAADWHYFDSLVPANRNLGNAWRTEIYSENADWKIGAAELGYGDSDEVTTINDNPDPVFNQGAGDKFITYYFRRTLDITNVHNVTGVTLQLRYDDGGVIYINGVEVGRTANMGAPGTQVTFDQLAAGNVNDNSTQDFTVPDGLLRSGDNLIAVEVHQNQPTSSDLSFDLRLRLDRAIPASVLANDTDPDPGQTATLTAAVVAPPAHGTLVLNLNGTFTYTPANGYTGPDSFTYRTTDTATLSSAAATVNINIITGPNSPPEARPDPDYVTQEDATLNVSTAAIGVLANDTDTENDPFTAALINQPSHGQLTLNPDGTFSYVPSANFNGIDTFSYRAVDTRGSAPATVTITVQPVNDTPVAADDSYAGDPGVPFVVTTGQGLLANDTDVDAGTVLTVQLVSPPATGDLTLNSDGSFSFSAATGGIYTFTYIAKDTASQSATATVTIALNAAPAAGEDSYTVNEDTPLSRTAAQGALSNDSDPEGQPITALLEAGVRHGTLSLQADGSFSYQPAANFFGSDSFTYRASDGTRQSAPVTVNITVNALNDAPVATADIYGARMDAPLEIPAANGVLRNDTDVDNSSLTATLIAPPAEGVLVFNADGAFTYSPPTGFSGSIIFTYRANDGITESSVAIVTLNVSAAQNTIAISEIMYNPPGRGGALEEFVEIHNYGDAAVDLTGWAFTKGINYTFPPGTLITTKAYLAIPANLASFNTKYPAATNVTSTAWGSAVSLSNGGELIRLRNAEDETVDEVPYSDSGDWALRKIVNVWDATNTPGLTPASGLDTDPGLEWVTTADPDVEIDNPGGSSIQLINIALTNKTGQNWTAAVPTPGAPNAAAAQLDSAPLIRDVIHSPTVPNRTQQVYVIARITDELDSGVNATVYYRTWGRNSTVPESADFTPVPMADNGLRGDGVVGDGIYGAVLPAQALNTVVEFYVQATDAAALKRTWPPPTLDLAGTGSSQNANCLYQVNEDVWTDHRPLYQLVLTGADNSAFNAGLSNRQSNVASNATLIFRQGGKYEVRYRGSIRARGNSSRGDTPMNLRMEIPGDTPWNGRTAFTLNYKYSYSQFLASRLFESSGIPVEKANVVGMRLNGQNRLLDSNGNRTFGYYCDLIPRGGDTIREWFPENEDGNAYGKIRGNVRWGISSLPVIGPSGLAEGGYVNQGYTKQTNAAQNDWTDLHAWMESLNAGTAETFHTTIAGTVDIDQWCRFLAMSTIINHAETNMANGDDDDYSVYFGAADKLCRIIAHDLDTCFNLNAIGLGDEIAPPTLSIYQCTEPNYPTDNATLPQMNKFYRNPVTGRKFKAALRQYLDTIFLKPTFDATVDQLLDNRWMGTQFTPNGDAIRTHIKSFLDTRRTTIEAFLPTAFTAATTLTLQGGLPRTTSPTNLGGLGGKLDPARTAEVKVNGIKVTTNPYGSTGADDNSWSAGTAISLAPGLNNLVCTAHDESGAIFATQTVSIWLDTPGVNKSGILADSESWTAAGGPYNVTANLTVPAGVVLTIEPGATVFVAPGSGINVTGGGRMFAQGTGAAGIRFQTNPAATGTWNGINISGATAEASVVSYATFANNGDTAVHARNGANVVLSYLTFLNPGEPFIEVDASSFYISDCVFPSSTAGFEPVHGSGGIAPGGRGIIERCHFGKTRGYNDSIDFTGGNRPGPILHIRDCTFAGSDDDILDLDSTDAWIERCVFLHAHRNGSPDSASAISGGQDNNDRSQVTVLNCLFYDCDNAVTMKQGNNGVATADPASGNSAVLLYNTIVRTTRTGGEDTGSGVINFDDEGFVGEARGFHLEGNIIWDAESLTRDWVPANSALVLTNNWLPSAPPDEAIATGNRTGDPMLNLALIPNPVTATVAQVVAALQPLACSPALGLGADMDIAHRSIRVSAPPGGVWPPNVSLSVGPGGSFTPNGQSAWTYGFTHYKYVLDGGSESAEFPIAIPLTLTGLAAGSHSLTIVAKDDSGVWVDGGYALSFNVATDAPTVVLSEVLAAGEEFIELHNYGTADASLAGCSLLTADSQPVEIYTFAAGTTIPAGGRLLVDGTHLTFKINSSGETIHFRSPGDADLDTVAFGPQITGMSIARVGNTWALSTPTPAAANTAACELGTGAFVRINEWIGSNNLIVAGDFVELYNGEGKPVNLAGWNITDDFRNEPGANEFPPLSFIPASGFLELIADGDRAAGADHLDFKVSRLRDDITLLNASGTLLDHVFVLPGNPDVSQGRTPDGSATAAYLALPTPGFSNDSDLSADIGVMNSLRITEIMFDAPSAGPEFIEFRNIGNATLSLAGVRFDSGITFAFPSLTVDAGGYAVITNDLVKFAARHPGVTATQWTGGRLDNNGETIRLETGSYGLGILDFRYEGDWYPSARSGASLEIMNPSATRSSWSDAASWQPCVPSPGGPSAFGVLAPLDMTVIPPGPAILTGFVCPGPYQTTEITVAWEKVSGPGTVTFTAPANKDTDASFSHPGTYVLSITATPPGEAPSMIDTVTIVYEEPVLPIIPGNGTLACNVGSSTKVTGAALAGLATGGNGPLSVSAVQSIATNLGGSVTLQDGWLIYEPAIGAAGLDTFTYTLTDGSQSVTGTVAVVITIPLGPSVNIVGVVTEGAGLRLGGSGIPGRIYRWQTSSDLAVWTLLGSPAVCPANGAITVIDPGPLPPRRYYRLDEFGP